MALPPNDSLKPHGIVLDRFMDAIMNGSPLIARADEGLHSLAMANAIMLSSATGRTVGLGEADQWETHLERLKASSTRQKKTSSGTMNFDESWNKTT